MKQLFTFNLSLRQKLLLGFGINILFVAAIVLSTTLILGGTTSSVKLIQDEAFPLALAGIEVERSIHSMVLEIKAAVESPTPSGLDKARKVRDALSLPIGNLMFLMERDPQAMAALQGIDDGIKELFDIGMELHKAKTHQELDKVTDLMGRLALVEENLLLQVTGLKESGVIKLEGAIDDIIQRSSGSRKLTIILATVAIVLSILVLTILSLSIMRPITNLVNLMKEAEQGDLSARYSNHELVRCWEELGCDKPECPAYGLNDLRCWQIAGTHSDDDLGEMTAGDEKACEACRVYKRATGNEFSAIGEAFNNMVAGLVTLIRIVSRASDEVMSVSKNLLALSEDLRQGSDQQARSVDEVTASIEAMNTTIKNVAQNVKGYYESTEESNTSLLEMTASIEEVAHNSETLTGIVEKTTGLLDDLTVSIREVAQHSSGLSEQLEMSSSALMQINTSVGMVAESARESSHMASFVTEKLKEKGETAVKKTSESILEVREIVTDAATVIRDLGERSSNIGNILHVIDEVSDQTRLLSLNAAILAAQSGAEGKAFSVIAEEIRALSERTSSSTQEITNLLSSIPVEVEKVTRAILRGTEKVDEGVKLIMEVQQAIAEVSDAARRSAEASDLIMDATSEQASGILQASQLEQNISVMSKEIAEATRYQAESCEQIMESANQMKELAVQVKRATVEQASGTKYISHASSESMKMAKTITEATREEARGSELILKSIEAVSAATSGNMEVFAQLGEMVASLTEHSRLLQEEMGRFRVNGNEGIES